MPTLAYARHFEPVPRYVGAKECATISETGPSHTVHAIDGLPRKEFAVFVAQRGVIIGECEWVAVSSFGVGSVVGNIDQDFDEQLKR